MLKTILIILTIYILIGVENRSFMGEYSSKWYWEERRDGVRRVSWYNKLSGDTFHSVVLPPAPLIGFADWHDVQPCWTLFFHQSEYVKPWSFLKAEPRRAAK